MTAIVPDAALSYRVFAATAEFITQSTDSPVSQPFAGTLQRALHLTRSIIGGAVGFTQFAATWGDLTIINSEADYDTIVNQYAVDGRRVVVKAGQFDTTVTPAAVKAYSTFFTLFDGTATGWHINDNSLLVTLRDNSYKLEVPAQPSIYGGTGDLDGGSDLAGKKKPRAFGSLLNVTPVLLIAAELVYQLNNGPISAISAIYDTGATLTATSDYATPTLLRAAALVPGQYATCLASGLFRLGGAAFGQVTCDLSGDSSGAGYVSSAADIVRRVVATAISDPGDLETWTFDAVNDVQAAVIGYYLGPDSNETVMAVCTKIMASIGGWCGFNAIGDFGVRRFLAPDISAAASYVNTDIVSIARETLPSTIDPPPWRFRVAYARNWTQQTTLVATVGQNNPARAAYLASPYNVATTAVADGLTIKNDHPLAQDPAVIEAFFANQSDAQDEADRLLALYSTTRSLYRIRIKARQFCHELDQVVFVTYPRWDLTNGRYLRIVEIVDDTDENFAEIVGFG